MSSMSMSSMSMSSMDEHGHHVTTSPHCSCILINKKLYNAHVCTLTLIYKKLYTAHAHVFLQYFEILNFLQLLRVFLFPLYLNEWL
jgi:hypothetical protein